MRKIAKVEKQNSEIYRLMIYESNGEVLVFLYDIEEDGSCCSCEWYITIEEAEKACFEEYEVEKSNWKTIDAPQAGCQHDWIKPTKVRRDAKGNPVWGEFEPGEVVNE